MNIICRHLCVSVTKLGPLLWSSSTITRNCAQKSIVFVSHKACLKWKEKSCLFFFSKSNNSKTLYIHIEAQMKIQKNKLKDYTLHIYIHLSSMKHGYIHGHRTRQRHWHADTVNNVRKSHNSGVVSVLETTRIRHRDTPNLRSVHTS